MTETKPREYWIQAIFGNIALRHEKPIWFSHHVIDYSAYNQANERIKELEAELLAAREALNNISQEVCLLGHEDNCLCCLIEASTIEQAEEALSRIEKFLNKDKGE